MKVLVPPLRRLLLAVFASRGTLLERKLLDGPFCLNETPKVNGLDPVWWTPR